MFISNSPGQGTIEYLVVIAIVVVISLVVVGIVFTTNSSGDTAIKSAELRNSVGVIGFAEPVVDGSGDGLIGVSNNTGEAISISKISVAGVEKVFSESLPMGANKLFYLTDLSSACDCSAVGTQKICEVVVTYVSGYGLEKTETREVVFSCVGDAVAKSATVVGLTAVCGSSAQSYSWSATDFSGSFCSVGDANESSSFPVQGASVTWKCLGSDLNVTCSASRGTQAVAGLCGTANQAYAYNITSFGSDSFCSAGDSNATPSFPAQGASVSWKCVGSDTNANCLASRDAVPAGLSMGSTTISGFTTYGAYFNGTGTLVGGTVSGSDINQDSCFFTDNNGSTWSAGAWSTDHCVKTSYSTTNGLSKIFNFKISNNSGTIVYGTQTSEYTYDSVAPVTTYGSSCGNDWNSSAQTITLSCADSGSGCKSNGIRYRVDSGAWTTYSTAISLTIDGNHKLEYDSNDNVNNQEVTKTSYCAIRRIPVASFAQGTGAGTGTGSDYGNSVYVDLSGNIYLAGTFSSTSLDFGNNVSLTNRSIGQNDFFVVKYDSSGVAQWAKGPAFGIGQEDSQSVFVDSSGNVYLTGAFTSDAFGFGNDINLTKRGTYNFFVVKYNSSGVAQWAQGPVNNTSEGYHSWGRSVHVDSSGNVYLAGYFNLPLISFGNDINLSGPGYFIVKYNSSGVAQWATGAASGVTQDSVGSIFVDSSGNIYLTGYFLSSAFDQDLDFGNNVIIYNKTDNYAYSDFFVVKYNSSGVAQWARNPSSVTGTSGLEAHSVFVDSTGNVYVGGIFYSSTVSFDTGISLTHRGGGDFFVVKYNSSGVAQWAQGPSSSSDTNVEGSYSVFVDSNNNVYLAGYSKSTPLSFGNNVSLTNRGDYDFFVVKYNSSGVAQWAEGPASGTATGQDWGKSVFVDASGNVYLTGFFLNTTLGFNNDINLASRGNYDFFLVKYSN